MPGKKKNQVQQEPQEQETQTPAQEKPDSEEVNQRLARIEAAIERMSARPARVPSPTIMTTRGRAKANEKNNTASKQRRLVSMDPELSRENDNNSQSSSSTQHPHQPSHKRAVNRDTMADVQPRDQTAVHDVPVDLLTQHSGDPLTNVNKLAPPRQLIDVNTIPAGTGWAPQMDYTIGATSEVNSPQLTQHQQQYGFKTDDVERRVQDILASTASTLSRGNVKPGAYPFKYVLRGHERLKVSINSVSLSEHLWGLVCMIRDPKIDPSIRPYLYSHLLEVIEDTCDFDWECVRRWSEEVFTLIAENRLLGGWSSVSRIQMLRVTISRSPFNRAYSPPPRELHPRDQVRRPQPQQQQPFHSDPPKNGPPCTAYNTANGCNLPAGHMVNGRKVQHVCTFCLYNSCATCTHPESQCRNKNRFAPHHF